MANNVKLDFLTRNLKLEANLLKETIRKIKEFVERNGIFLNCHMVDFLTRNHWKNLLNESIREELCTVISQENLNEFKITEISNNSKYPNLFALVSEINKLHITKFLNKMKLPEDCEINIGEVQKMWISQKKFYETNVMARLLSSITKQCGNDLVVDLGCGKGYVPSLLALGYDLSVFGIESSDITQQSAVKRNRTFVGEFLKRNDKKQLEDVDKSPVRANGNFIVHKENISKKTDLTMLVNSNVSEKSNFLLTGLHLCGNLGSDVTHHFIHTKEASVLCYVGCCYHLIEEKFYKNPKMNEVCTEDEAGFPISEFLTREKFKLGRNARMLGCQSLERNTIQDKSQSVFFRALLEVILHDHRYTNKDDLRVGRLASKCSNFEEYVVKALDRLELGHLKNVVTQQKINQYLSNYSQWEPKLNLFQQIRILMGTVVEAAIILDRILFLTEQDTVKRCYLLQVFDPVKSPRCYCIIATK